MIDKDPDDFPTLLKEFIELKKKTKTIQSTENNLVAWYKRLLKKKGLPYVIKKLQLNIEKLKKINGT